MKYAKPEWRDDQPYNSEFDDIYFSSANGVAESMHVFINANQLASRFTRLSSQQFVVAETGFGSGLNFLLCMREWLKCANPDATLFFNSIELYPLRLEDLERAHRAWPELVEFSQALLQVYQVPSYGCHRFELFEGRVRLNLYIGDVATMLGDMQQSADAWFLDGFAPARNPDMWAPAILQRIAALSRQGTSFSTFTAVGEVRRQLQEAGFEVSRVNGFGSKREMLSGCKNADRVFSSGSQEAYPWYARESSAGSSRRVCIIGAGIAGLSAAHALVSRGYHVELVEAASGLGSGASGNPQGMIMPRLSLQDSADAEFYAVAYFYALRKLRQLDPDQSCWKESAGLQLPATERIRRQIEQHEQDPDWVVSVDAASASELSGLNVGETCHYAPKAATVYPASLLDLLVRQMAGQLVLRFNTRVTDMFYQDGCWQLHCDNGDVIQHDRVIVANACAARDFKQFKHLHLNPARGQVTLLKPSKRSRSLRVPVSYEGYLMPEYQGCHLAGASFSMDEVDTACREEDNRENIQALNAALGLGFNMDDISGQRAALRAVTADRCPVVGAAPDVAKYEQIYADLYKGKAASRYETAAYLPGLYISSGHGARGFTSAFLAAELLAAMINQECLPVTNRVRYALHPARFLIRSLKKKRS